MTSPPFIRPAERSDTAEITRLCEALGYPVTLADIETRLDTLGATGRHFIAVAPGEGSVLCGWVAAEHRVLLESGERAEIVGLVVDNTLRRKGFGKSLVSSVETWAAKRGLSEVFVRSNIARDEAHRFYEGVGYSRTKTQHAYTKTISTE